MGVALAPHKNSQIDHRHHQQQPQDRGARLACGGGGGGGRLPSPSSKENSRPNREPLEQQQQPPASSAPPMSATTTIANHKKKKKKKKPQQQQYRHASPPPPPPPPPPASPPPEVEIVSLHSFQALQGTLDALRSACLASQQHRTGLAEIDKVLAAVTPKLSTCSASSRSAPPPCLCRLKNPAFLRKAVLGSVWEWFEEPSICGMQVKSIGEGDESFDAYLVPYISAIRLYGNLSDGTVPLLFEFYETEQLTFRLPLHHRVQELLKEENPSACIINGDPALLESCSLRSLHPSSWFAVAWYPIYKVPEGQFRCVFLTYHSLGHVQASGSLPVLGLQTYHCQGEDWFTLKQGSSSSSKDSETLKQRLSSLDRAASVMSRGSDPKSQTFQHSDYEFFTRRKY